MTHPLSEDTLALSSSSVDSQAVSNRLPYRPPFLTTLAVNSHTGSKPSTLPGEGTTPSGAPYNAS